MTWMPSGLPALSSFSSSFGSLVRKGLPSLPYPYFVPPAVPTTCSDGTPYAFSAYTLTKSCPPPVTMKVL
jgi:hypothetical protein